MEEGRMIRTRPSSSECFTRTYGGGVLRDGRSLTEDGGGGGSDSDDGELHCDVGKVG